MPSALATRASAGVTVSVKSDRHSETFMMGLKSFINEARLLAQFNHPALVKVYRFWEANGTAYMVMPYYEGPTLKQALADLRHAPEEAALRAWLMPLLDALEVMHAAHCFHRDIAPDNILLTVTGPLLLDFGAARRVIGDMTHALTAVLKPGYAPIEQYGDAKQGAWTDLYAVASVVYFAITGKPPMSSVERLIDDKLPSVAKLASGRYSDALLSAIDRTLAVRPEARPQNVAQFRAMLDTGPISQIAPEPSHKLGASALSQPSVAQAATVSNQQVQRLHPQGDNESGRRVSFPWLPLTVIVVLSAMAASAWFISTRVQPVKTKDASYSPAIALIPKPANSESSGASTPSPPEPGTELLKQAIQVKEAPPKTITPASVSKPKTKATPLKTLVTTNAFAVSKKEIPEVTHHESSTQAICSDIIQKASLESLSVEESTFLKRECK